MTPPDHFVGKVEKDIKRCETIVDPNQCLEIIKNYSTIKKKPGEDVVNSNWKVTVAEIVKASISWHFGIKACKRIYLTKTTSKKF